MATPVMVAPFKPPVVQTAGVIELNVTGRLEDAVALIVVVAPAVRVAGLKVIAPIVWFVRPAVIFFVPCGAGL